VEGGCNIQFALNQKTGEYYVVEVNPRLSRSSALASKATGYPIARVAAKIALGMGLHEIKNAVTKTTPAAFEPALDYCVLKIPRWPFDKIPEGDRTIGTQMKSTGETMAIGRTFEEAFGKALRSVEMKKPKIAAHEIERHLSAPTDLRIYAVLEALRLGWDKQKVHELTGIHMWFIDRLAAYANMENRLKREAFGRNLLYEAKRLGYSDEQVAQAIGHEASMVREMRKKAGIVPVYKMVDTCAAEFEAATPYYYSTYENENESKPSGRRKVVIIGSGPIRIGQGIEFDYCCCHAAFALREMGIESIMINNNPETVSTDFDTSDRLYFEPLTFEDVMNVIEHEKPEGVIVQFGGQTSINLAQKLYMAGAKILGTPMEGIDIAEDREKFKALLHELGIRQPENATATSEEEAVAMAAKIGYPIVVRPSYVIAGRGMQIVHDEESLRKYIGEAVEVSERKPVLIDKYVERAIECEIDGVADGKRLFVGGIMEHVERAGVHSGDAFNAVPCVRLKKEVQGKILEYSERIALALGTVGAINIQYVVQNDVVFVLEANPRASRTVPFLSKATGIPLAKLATKAIMGKGLDELGVGSMPHLSHFAVKGTVFPFLKLPGADSVLGPEMKSTGESMGVDYDFPLAFMKAILGANFKIPRSGGVAMSFKDGDKERAKPLADALHAMGFEVYATPTTAGYIGGAVKMLKKIADGEPNIISEIKKGKIPQRGGRLPILTASKSEEPAWRTAYHASRILRLARRLWKRCGMPAGGNCMLKGLMNMAAGLDTKSAAIVALLLFCGLLLGYLAFASAQPCAGCNAKAEFVFSPGAEDEVIALIRSAQKTIDIEMYVFTSEDIMRELSEAKNRGVQVRVIMEPRVDDDRKTKTFAILQELGIETKWASFGYKLTHAKFIIVDGRKALVGSINLSESALTKNREAAVLIESESVKDLVSLFEEDWQKAGGGLGGAGLRGQSPLGLAFEEDWQKAGAG